MINRELELRFIIAANDGDIDEINSCITNGVNIECRATDSELNEYRSLRLARINGHVDIVTLLETQLQLNGNAALSPADNNNQLP